jgi:hypothetical protein
MPSNIPPQYRPPRATLVPMVSRRQRQWIAALQTQAQTTGVTAAITNDAGTKVITNDAGTHYLTWQETV